MKDDAIPSTSSSFPQPSSSGSPLVNIHAQKNPSVGRLTGTSSAANQLVLNAMTHTLTLDQIQTLVDECFGFSALNPDKTTLTYQVWKSGLITMVNCIVDRLYSNRTGVSELVHGAEESCSNA